MVKNGYIYQEATHNNIVFVSYDNVEGKKVPVYAGLKGTSMNKPFCGDVMGCDYNKCFFVDNKSNILIVTEAVIDALSIMSIQKDDYKSYNYLALTGVRKTGAIDRWLNKNSIYEIVLSLDNDDAGREATEKLEKRIKEKRPDIKVSVRTARDGFKDFNDELKHKTINNVPIEKIITKDDRQPIRIATPYCNKIL